MTAAAEPNVVPLAHRREGGHWLVFSDDYRAITGCHCGFVADPGDHGYGDSVLDHFELEVRADEQASNPSRVWLVYDLAPDITGGPSEVFSSFEAVQRAYPRDWKQQSKSRWTLHGPGLDIYGIGACEMEVQDA